MAKTKLDGLAERLAKARESVPGELTQKQVGQALNRSAPCIGQWEQGKSEPSLADLMALASLYNVTPQYLLGLTAQQNDGAAHIPLLTSEQLATGRGNPVGYIQTSRPYRTGSTFAWKADTSAINRCASGDTVVIERTGKAQADGIYMIAAPGSVPTLRRCQRDAGELFFFPDAQGFQIYNASEVVVIGKVREIIKYAVIE